MTESEHTDHPELFLTEGGPTYRIEKSLRLISERSPRVIRRACFSILLTWIPLLVLCLLHGTALGQSVKVPFLRDIAAYARFLLALPLLLVAETVLGPHIAHAAAHFIDSGLVLKEDYKSFDDAVYQGLRGRDSAAAEGILLLLAYAGAYLSLKSLAIPVATWYAIPNGTTFTLTPAGWWFVFFCVPLFQFLVLRWIWRLFLWGQFLWRMLQLHLELIPTHPDESAGLGFVGETHRFFSVILLALSISTAGVLGNDIVYGNIPLPHFASLIVIYVIICVGIFLLPLTIFVPTLQQTKRAGLYKYGSLATEYTSSFDKKWIGTLPPREETLLGTGDIQSLADLGNSYSFIEKMGLMPMDHHTPISLVAACLIPMVPLLLTMMPLKDLVKMLIKFVL